MNAIPQNLQADARILSALTLAIATHCTGLEADAVDDALASAAIELAERVEGDVIDLSTETAVRLADITGPLLACLHATRDASDEAERGSCETRSGLLSSRCRWLQFLSRDLAKQLATELVQEAKA